MKPTTLEWISKAEEDWHVAQMSYRARKHPSYDAAVFHAQQCAEKYLKARLEEAGVVFGRTHDLLLLHSLALPVEPTWSSLQCFLISLNPFGVAYRYPGISATKADAKAAALLRKCARSERLGFRDNAAFVGLASTALAESLFVQRRSLADHGIA